MIIADENLERYWVELLRSQPYEVLSIAETHPQISDEQVAEIAKKNKGILITEDKDFGELIFAHGIANLSVIFLRYDQPNYSQIEKSLLEIISKYHDSDECYFITITEKKIRVRFL